MRPSRRFFFFFLLLPLQISRAIGTLSVIQDSLSFFLPSFFVLLSLSPFLVYSAIRPSGVNALWSITDSHFNGNTRAYGCPYILCCVIFRCARVCITTEYFSWIDLTLIYLLCYVCDKMCDSMIILLCNIDSKGG